MDTTPRSILSVFVIVLLGGCFYLGGEWIRATDHSPTTINVSGDGKAFAAPDIAELSLGMDTGRQNSAKDAMALLKTNMEKVIAAVKATGVADKDIATAQFSLSPEYDYTDGRQVLRGFRAMENLTVKVRDLDKTSDVLGAATAAGANQAGDVQFTIDNPDTVQATAREEALTKARAKAQKLASDLGMTLGKIKGFSEGGGYQPVPMMRNEMKALDSGAGAVAAAVPLPTGQQEVQVTVNLTYELR